MEGLIRIEMKDRIELHREVEELIGQTCLPLQVALERELAYQRIEMERDQAYQRSIRDPLTGLFTRSYMQDVVQRLCDLQDRNENVQVFLLMLDLDHFKQVNDTHGHAIGDEVLRTVAKTLSARIRTTDIPIRFGGEEFMVFMSCRAGNDPLLWAERLQRVIGATRIPLPDGRGEALRVTVSGGLAARLYRESLPSLIRRADDALYQAKKSGRNRIVQASQKIPTSNG